MIKILKNKIINKYKPTIPKDASSLIILKKSKKSIEVLMGRRPKTSRFMPGIYVFPGGGLEKIDYSIKTTNVLHDSISKEKLKARSSSHTKALVMASIRETAEETGLMLASKGKIKIKKEKILNNGWLNFYKNNYEPAIDKILYLGRAITPSTLKIRFHARFFLSEEKYFKGSLTSTSELEELSWVPLEDTKKLQCADVTEFMISELIKLKGEYNKLAEPQNRPMFTWKNGKKWTSWS